MRKTALLLASVTTALLLGTGASGGCGYSGDGKGSNQHLNEEEIRVVRRAMRKVIRASGNEPLSVGAND